MDFFTPVVDDPYAYGQIAAANALSDVYAMGGQPLTVMNIACFNPLAAGPEVWAAVLKGMYDKTMEAGAIVVGGHSVEDQEPKFGMAVTGLIHPSKVFDNRNAQPGDQISLSKPLGTGVLTTGIKRDLTSPEEAERVTQTMAALNRVASERGVESGVRCATDITGFGLAGHLFNIAEASGVEIHLDTAALPLLPGLMRLIDLDCAPGGAIKNRKHLADRLIISEGVDPRFETVVTDPQTSGGLALFSTGQVGDYPVIGEVRAGTPKIVLR